MEISTETKNRVFVPLFFFPFLSLSLICSSASPPSFSLVCQHEYPSFPFVCHFQLCCSSIRRGSLFQDPFCQWRWCCWKVWFLSWIYKDTQRRIIMYYCGSASTIGHWNDFLCLKQLLTISSSCYRGGSFITICISLAAAGVITW